jgi:hypothetical protein
VADSEQSIFRRLPKHNHKSSLSTGIPSHSHRSFLGFLGLVNLKGPSSPFLGPVTATAAVPGSNPSLRMCTMAGSTISSDEWQDGKIVMPGDRFKNLASLSAYGTVQVISYVAIASRLSLKFRNRGRLEWASVLQEKILSL